MLLFARLTAHWYLSPCGRSATSNAAVCCWLQLRYDSYIVMCVHRTLLLTGPEITVSITSTVRPRRIRTMPSADSSSRTSVGCCVANIRTSRPKAKVLICPTCTVIRCSSSRRNTTWYWCPSCALSFLQSSRATSGTRPHTTLGSCPPCCVTVSTWMSHG